MAPVFVFALSFAAIQQIAQPTPSATLPPEIIHTVTSETCGALPSLFLPIGHTSQLNDRGFGAMAVAVDGYMSHVMLGDDPNIKRPSLEVASAMVVQPGSAKKGGLGGASRADDPVVYGPDQTIKMSRINAIAGQLAVNITHERQLLAQSYQEEPRGKNPPLDALRQKTEALVEGQESLVQRYQNLASAYLENIGEVGIECNSDACASAFNNNLRSLVFGSSVGLGAAAHPAPSAASTGYTDLKQVSKVGTSAEVVAAMRSNEAQFSAAIYDLYNQCHGTHYVVPETTHESAAVP